MKKTEKTEQARAATIPAGRCVYADAAERRAYFKREARQTLLTGGNWLPVIFSFLILMFFTVGIKYLHETVFYTAELTGYAAYAGLRLDRLLRVSGDIFLFFGVSPLLPGIYAYLAGLYISRGVTGSDKAIRIGDIFAYYSSFSALCEAYRLVFAYIWKFAAAAGVVRLFRSAWIQLVRPSRTAVPAFLFTLSVCAVAALLIFLFMQTSCLWYCACCRPGNSTLRDARRESVQILRGHMAEAMMLVLSFMLWSVVSLLTAGVLLLFAVPYFLLTHISFCSYLSAAKVHKKAAAADSEREAAGHAGILSVPNAKVDGTAQETERQKLGT